MDEGPQSEKDRFDVFYRGNADVFAGWAAGVPDDLGIRLLRRESTGDS